MDHYGIDGFEYRNGYVCFDDSRIVKHTFKNIQLTKNRTKNFQRADREFEERLGISRGIAKRFRASRYTIHECENLTDAQLIPSIIHNNLPHSGAISILQDE